MALIGSVRHLCLAVAAFGIISNANADVWVFEPSVALDQRFDDNYRLEPGQSNGVNATRVVGSLGLNRESEAASIRGLLRIDGLLAQGDVASEELSSNQILFIESIWKRPRSEFGLGFNLKRDTPSRDISSDITDISSTAADTGASTTQDNNVGRTRIIVSPRFSYNLSRRSSIETGITYTDVTHELTSPADAIRDQWLLLPENQGQEVPGDLSIDDLDTPFTIDDELDDFSEVALTLKYKYDLTPLVQVSALIGYSQYEALTEPDNSLVIPFEDKEIDADEPLILRDPKRKSLSNTKTFRLGYDRLLSPTLNLGLQLGIYQTETDDSDLFRAGNDDPLVQLPIETTDGWLANITVRKDAGVNQYSARLGVDVFPSDVGRQVESFEAVGDFERTLRPLLDFSFRVRAYEPDVLNSTNDDEFARRFLSFEPKLIWRYSRAWTAAASFRYRRQKSQVDLESGESNAVLFSIKYTPPSEIRDLAGG
ncbi:MAG: hypothetical protein KTR35_05725 [Gammaproteobacteria bacterium]|nr:hypothetical protein [Gammaproteobacteria bacterium]